MAAKAGRPPGVEKAHGPLGHTLLEDSSIT